MKTIKDIRNMFADLYTDQKYVTDKSGAKTLEIMGASFIADEDSIFGAVNEDYVERELEWYISESLNVNDIPGGPPTIWKQVADPDGFINSNYGWCIFSFANHRQFSHVIDELLEKPDSRRAIMIYTRPNMWIDYKLNGRSDFMCTNTVQYMIRDNRVHAIVNMRSNDAWAGYRNDYAWQKFVLSVVVLFLNSAGNNYEKGDIHWFVGSLHLYERQFYLIDHFVKTGETSISKDEYERKYAMDGSFSGTSESNINLEQGPQS